MFPVPIYCLAKKISLSAHGVQFGIVVSLFLFAL